MITILDFLNQQAGHESKSKQMGDFTDWLEFVELDLKGDALQFTETRVLGLRGNENSECHEIPATPGKYTVQCKGVSFGNDRRIAALRAFPKGRTVTVGMKVAEIPVDFGGVSVVDIATMSPSIDEDEERHQEWIEDTLYGDDLSAVSIHEWPITQTKIPSVESGFGDGVYDLLELSADGEIVGLQIVFIEEGQHFGQFFAGSA